MKPPLLSNASRRRGKRTWSSVSKIKKKRFGCGNATKKIFYVKFGRNPHNAARISRLMWLRTGKPTLQREDNPTVVMQL